MSYLTSIWFLKVTYVLWGHNLVKDIEARKLYEHNVVKYSLEMQEEVRRGHLQVEEAAVMSWKHRNKQVLEMRGASSALGETIAKFLKKELPSYQDRLDRYAKRVFAVNFDRLNVENKNAVSEATQGLDSPALIYPFAGADAGTQSVRPVQWSSQQYIETIRPHSCGNDGGYGGRDIASSCEGGGVGV